MSIPQIKSGNERFSLPQNIKEEGLSFHNSAPQKTVDTVLERFISPQFHQVLKEPLVRFIEQGNQLSYDPSSDIVSIRQQRLFNEAMIQNEIFRVAKEQAQNNEYERARLEVAAAQQAEERAMQDARDAAPSSSPTASSVIRTAEKFSGTKITSLGVGICLAGSLGFGFVSPEATKTVEEQIAAAKQVIQNDFDAREKSVNAACEQAKVAAKQQNVPDDALPNCNPQTQKKTTQNIPSTPAS